MERKLAADVQKIMDKLQEAEPAFVPEQEPVKDGILMRIDAEITDLQTQLDTAEKAYKTFKAAKDFTLVQKLQNQIREKEESREAAEAAAKRQQEMPGIV